MTSAAEESAPAEECLIAFGANQGNREQMLARALTALESAGFADCRSSRLYSTRPIGGPEVQDVYANAVIRAKTGLNPSQVVAQLLAVEEACGRKRGERWAPRTIDLDLLLLGQQTSDDPRVQLPHPRMTCRRFVLEPACEIANEMRHPWSGATLGELYRAISRATPRTAVWLWPDDVAAPSALLLTEVQKELNSRGLTAHFRWAESDPHKLDFAADLTAGNAAGDWHILLLADPLQLKRLDVPPGLVIGWTSAQDGCLTVQGELALRLARKHVGAVVLLAPDLTEASREVVAALQAVGEFWDSSG